MRQDAPAVISIKHIPRDTVSREANSRPRNIDIAVLSGFTCSDGSTAIDRLEHVNQRPTSGIPPIRSALRSNYPARQRRGHRHRGVSSCGFLWFSKLLKFHNSCSHELHAWAEKVESKALLREDLQFQLQKEALPSLVDLDPLDIINRETCEFKKKYSCNIFYSYTSFD